MNRVTLSLAFLAFLAGVVGCNKTADIKVEEENPLEEMEAQPILLSRTLRESVRRLSIVTFFVVETA